MVEVQKVDSMSKSQDDWWTFDGDMNSNTKPIIDNAAGGAFMALTVTEETEILDRLIKASRGWHTRDFEVSSNTYSVGISLEQRQ